MTNNTRWFCRIFLVLGILVIGLAGAGHVASRILWAEGYQKFESVKPGMSQLEVEKLLGEPAYYYQKATAPQNYYVGGYSYREKPIEHSVLIYVGVEPIAYYYLDEAGRVDEIYIGGS